MAAGARICVGQIGAPHGVRGEVRLRSFTADPQSVASYGPFETEDGSNVAIEALRRVKDHFVATLAGVRDRDSAVRLTNAKLYVPRERLPDIIEADEFYHTDLIGLSAVSPEGQKVGTVIAVHNFGAGDLIEIRLDAESRTELIAFNEFNVPSIDVRNGRIVVQSSPLAGEDSDGGPPRSRKGKV